MACKGCQWPHGAASPLDPIGQPLDSSQPPRAGAWPALTGAGVVGRRSTVAAHDRSPCSALSPGATETLWLSTGGTPALGPHLNREATSLPASCSTTGELSLPARWCTLLASLVTRSTDVVVEQFLKGLCLVFTLDAQPGEIVSEPGCLVAQLHERAPPQQQRWNQHAQQCESDHEARHLFLSFLSPARCKTSADHGRM